MYIYSKYLTPILLTLTIVTLAGCSDSDSDPDTASIVPGINPAFDTITEVASSAAASGTYSAIASTEYSYQDEVITLTEGTVSSGGLYLKITGDATLDGNQSSYTVYTFAANNASSVAANELTSTAVLRVGNGDSETFDAAIASVATSTGLSSSDITSATKADDREEELTQLMRTLAPYFRDGAAIPGTTNPTNIALVEAHDLENIALGAHAYDNWLKVCSAQDCSDKPSTPDEIKVSQSDESTVEYDEFVRCSSCHGWDMLGEKGGFAFRSRSQDGEYISRPDSGSAGTSESRDISAGGVETDDIINAGSTNRYANNPTATPFVAEIISAEDWNAVLNVEGTNIKKSDEHPNFDSSADGRINSVAPSNEVIEALTAFLNYEDAKWSKVFESIEPDTNSETIDHTLVSTANSARGAQYYATYCFRCHGAPNNSGPNLLNGFSSTVTGNFATYLNSEGNHSRLRFRAQWGKAGSAMTRTRLGDPTSADVADLMAFLQGVNLGDITEGTGFSHLGDVTAGNTMYDNICANCHKAKVYDTTSKFFDLDTGESVTEPDEDSVEAPDLTARHFRMQKDLGDLSDIMGRAPKLTQQEINDLAAFLSSPLVDEASESL